MLVLARTNPPFSMDYTEANSQEAEILARSEIGPAGIYDTSNRAASVRGDVMFLEHYHDLLKPGRRLVTVVDFRNRGGPVDNSRFLPRQRSHRTSSSSLGRRLGWIVLLRAGAGREATHYRDSSNGPARGKGCSRLLEGGLGSELGRIPRFRSSVFGSAGGGGPFDFTQPVRSEVSIRDGGSDSMPVDYGLGARTWHPPKRSQPTAFLLPPGSAATKIHPVRIRARMRHRT